MDFYKAQNLTDQPRAPPKLGGSPTAFLGSSDRTAAVTGTVFSRSCCAASWQPLAEPRIVRRCLQGWVRPALGKHLQSRGKRVIVDVLCSPCGRKTRARSRRDVFEGSWERP